MPRFVLPLAMLLAACLGSCAPTLATVVNFPLIVRKEWTIKTPSAAVAVAWSPDGSKIAAAIDWGTTIVVWDQSGREVSRFPAGGSNLFGSLAFGANASQVLSAPPHNDLGKITLTVLASKSGGLLREIPLPVTAFDTQAGPYDVSPDHRLLAVTLLGRGMTRPDVALFATDDWRLLRTYSTGVGAMKAGFFDQGRKLLVGSASNQVVIYDAGSDRELGRFAAALSAPVNSASVEAVAGSPDGAFVFAGQGDDTAAAATVYRASDGARVASFPLSVRQSIGQASWDPKGRYLALVDHNCHLVLWRPLSTRLSYEIISIADAGLALAVSPDGSRIAVVRDSGVDVYSVT